VGTKYQNVLPGKLQRMVLKTVTVSYAADALLLAQ